MVNFPGQGRTRTRQRMVMNQPPWSRFVNWAPDTSIPESPWVVPPAPVEVAPYACRFADASEWGGFKRICSGEALTPRGGD